jgi:phosphoribosylglycinamide formyltransferase-1
MTRAAPRLGVMVSGRGSNLEAVLDAGIGVVIVISNRPAVPALDIGSAHGVPTLVVRRGDFGDAEARDGAIGRALTDASVTLCLLAGYDQRLRDSFFAAYPGRAINIHPSLLPAHGGPGMVGRAVHQAVLDAGDTETGVTIHEVIPELDAGSIVAQASVPVLPGDDADTLAARVLVEEHRLLVATLRQVME